MVIKNILGNPENKKLEKAVADIQYKKQLVERNISSEIQAINAQINSQYVAIGQAVYELSLNGIQPADEVQENINKITELKASTEEKKAKLLEALTRYNEELALINPTGVNQVLMMGGPKCTSCGAVLTTGDMFCQGCGGMVGSNAAVAAMDGSRCASCGSVLADEDLFCQGCGAKKIL